MIVAAVQARMGSTRLPNKVLAEIAGRPMIWHIVQRLRFAKHVDQVVIATADNESNRPIRAFAEKHNIPCFAGSEVDLIDRLHTLTSSYGAEALVRVTADCPLADPAVVDQLIEIYQSSRPGVDFASNVLPQSFPHGLDAEVYAASMLERLWREIDHPFWREWFPAYVGEKRESFRIVNLSHSTDLTRYRWTVDYEEDLAFVRAVYGRLYRHGEVFGMYEVIDLLDRSPELRDINARHCAHTREAGIRSAFESYAKSEASPRT